MAIFNKDKFLKLKEDEKKTKKPIIMVVDDEPKVLETIESFLSEDYQVITATGGKEALEMIEKMERPEDLSLIISDQRMPSVSGVQLLEKIAAKIPYTYRIILTAYSDPQTILDAVNKAKIYEYILKPFEPMDLLSKVKKASNAFQQRQRNEVYCKQCKKESEAEKKALQEKIRELEAQNKALLEQLEDSPIKKS